MIRIEIFAIALANLNGGFDTPDSKAFKLRNPMLLKTYAPEKKKDSENYRVFTTISGGLKAGTADIAAKCSGKSHRLGPENTIKDLLTVYGVRDERTIRRIIIFLQKALADETIYSGTKIGWLLEAPEIKETEDVCPKT